MDIPNSKAWVESLASSSDSSWLPLPNLSSDSLIKIDI